jgi:hypothetical protein
MNAQKTTIFLVLARLTCPCFLVRYGRSAEALFSRSAAYTVRHTRLSFRTRIERLGNVREQNVRHLLRVDEYQRDGRAFLITESIDRPADHLQARKYAYREDVDHD